MFNCRGTGVESQLIACKREIVKAPVRDEARVTPRAVKFCTTKTCYEGDA